MNGEKDSYRHTWTYDLDGTSTGERSAFCEKSRLPVAPDSRGLWEGAGGRACPSPANLIIIGIRERPDDLLGAQQRLS